MGTDVEPKIRIYSQELRPRGGWNCPGSKTSVKEHLELGSSMLDVECLLMKEANRSLRDSGKSVGFQLVHGPREEESWDLRGMSLHPSAGRSL